MLFLEGLSSFRIHFYFINNFLLIFQPIIKRYKTNLVSFFIRCVGWYVLSEKEREKRIENKREEKRES
jgi:hypothetical protein